MIVTHWILGCVIVLWVWQERTNHNPWGTDGSYVEVAVFALWFIVPIATLVYWLRNVDPPDLRPGVLAASAGVLGVVELWAAWTLFVNM